MTTATETAPVVEISKTSNKDKFDARLGSNASRVNLAITEEPQTIKQITEAAMLDRPDKYNVWNHVQKLIVKGVVLKTDKGYCLPPTVKEELPETDKAEKKRKRKSRAKAKATADSKEIPEMSAEDREKLGFAPVLNA